MNQTKRKIILASGILSLISAGIAVIAGVILLSYFNLVKELLYDYFMTMGYIAMSSVRAVLIMAIAEIFISGIGSALAGGFLLGSIRNGGKSFSKSRRLYITGAVFTILSGVASIASILLYISMAIKEEQVVREFSINTNQNGLVEPISEEKEETVKKDVKEKISRLRKLKEEGIISEEEFNDQIMKLL